MTGSPGEGRSRGLALGLLACALVLGSLPRIDAVSRFFPPERDQRTDVRLYYASMADSALEGRGWLPSYPTNFIPPPGQAVFIYVLKRLWPGADFQHLRSVQAVVSILTILLGFAAGGLLHGRWCGALCAWLLAIQYRLSELVGVLLPETSYTFCLFAGTVVLLAALRGRRRDLFLAAGTLLGVACLFKPTPTLLPPVLALLIGLRGRTKESWGRGAALLLGFLLAVAPWIVRNRVYYGHLLPISTNGGTLLALANAPGLDASRADMTFWDDLYKLDYYKDPEIEARFAGMRDRDGKAEENLKDRAYRRKALRYMAAHPLHFARNYAYKLRSFVWYPEETAEGSGPFPFRELPGATRGTVLAGLMGLLALALAKKESDGAWAVTTIALYFLAFGALYHLTRDGRMNLFWRAFLSLPASFLVTWVIESAQRSRGNSGVSKLKPVAGSTATALPVSPP